MKLHQLENYKSIVSLDDFDLPDFSMITGLNGAGKTHFLESIRYGKTEVDDLNQSQIQYFDYENFRLLNPGTAQIDTINRQKSDAWNIYASSLKNYLDEKAGAFSYEEKRILADLAEKPGTPFLNLPISDLPADELKKKYSDYAFEVGNYLKGFLEQESSPERRALVSVLFKLEKPLELMDRDQFHDSYETTFPIGIGVGATYNGFSGQSLSEYILSYYKKKWDNDFRRYRDQQRNELSSTYSEEEFEKKWPNPINRIEAVLSSYNSLDFKVETPDQQRSDVTGQYSVKLIHNKKKLQLNFDQLSSGEKMLITLALNVFRYSQDLNNTKLILLDEVDAPLHPECIGNFLSSLKHDFLGNGFKIIMVSHSPTTIGLLDNDVPIFVINTDSGRTNLNQVDRKKAISFLTDGFVTLEEGLKIFDQATRKTVTIMTEGNNVDYIQSVVDNLNISDKVEVFEGFRHLTGTSHLKTLFEFFALAKPQNKVIFVFDYDSDDSKLATENSLIERNNTYRFVFSKNTDNQLAKKGIENLLDLALIEEFKKVSKSSHVGILHDDEKKPLLEYVMARNNFRDLVNFRALFDSKINGLILQPTMLTTATKIENLEK